MVAVSYNNLWKLLIDKGMNKTELKQGELDLLSGGAPCQSFSYAGKRLGLEDARGTLFYHYAKFLEQLQPKMFLFENVRGLLTHDKGRTYKTITDIFESTGYTIQKKVLNAWNYGVAQKRERLITIGIRNDLTNQIAVTPLSLVRLLSVKTHVARVSPMNGSSAEVSAHSTSRSAMQYP